MHLSAWCDAQRALYGILFHDINMQRTLIDQSFSRMVALPRAIINTGEDNYLTTQVSYRSAYCFGITVDQRTIRAQLARRRSKWV